MKPFKRFISIIPLWAYMFVLASIFVNTVHFIYHMDNAPEGTAVFLWSMYLLMILFSLVSLILLYKKPQDKAVLLFYIYLQCIILTVNASYLDEKDPFSMMATVAFILGGPFIGPVLLHFQLIFPKPSKIILRYKGLPLLFYSIGAITAIGTSILYIQEWTKGILFSPAFYDIIRISLWFLSATYILSVAIAIYQYITIKDTYSRNQTRILLIGVFFSLVFAIILTLFYESIQKFGDEFPYLIPLLNGITRLILISCILIAIFRYRIWNIEIFIRKALLYLVATLVIILSYLLFLYLVDFFTVRETKVTRFVILAISVFIFLALRDWFQRMIERIFHRETYDSATVVSDFEEKLAGIYLVNDLKSGIVRRLDEIFHFKTFIFSMKKNERMYEPVFYLGVDPQIIDDKFEIDPGFERMLKKSKVFSPGELDNNLPLIEAASGELVIPLLKEDQPYGFFLCGPKKSEKTYSMQDIRVLSLIAKRVIALFQTASLYQNDLDRQLMLERERARIAQDMHDDIGAGLTKIAMISERVNSEKMTKVAVTAREMINRLNVIVWALNPRYDNLESLVSYARRYFGEYIENFDIGLRMEVSDDIPDIQVTPDFRRNTFYAWQEAIHNAVKHSKCSEVKIEVKINKQHLFITISDSGKGFDQAKPGSGGNGLLNMKKRAEELGGSLEIESAPGKGTRVVFGIPV